MAANSFTAKIKKAHVFEFEFQMKRLINEFSSPKFSASETCSVKWNLLLQEKNEEILFGLKRTDSVKDYEGLAVFCLFEIRTRNHEILHKHMFDCWFSCNESKYLSRPNRYSHANYSIEDVHYVTGHVIVFDCCKEKKSEKASLDDNITQLVNDFSTHMEIKENTDVKLNVRNEIVSAHKFVLCARSPFFRRMFKHDMADNRQGNFQIMDDIDKPVFDAFLSFLYTGTLQERDFNTVFDLYSVADKYEVKTLQRTCCNILTSYLSRSTVSPILKLADFHSDDDLKERAVSYICNNFSSVESSADWDKLLETDPRLASYVLKRVSTNVSK